MDNKDFDIDFDFEKEYGFDPNLFMSSDDDFDYAQFLDEEDPAAEAEEAEAEVDVAPVNMDETVIYPVDKAAETYDDAEYEDEDLTADIPSRKPYAAEEAAEEEFPEEEAAEYPEEYQDENLEEEPEAEQTEDAGEDMEGTKRFNLKVPKIKIPDFKKTGASRSGSSRKAEEPAKKTVFSKLLDAYMEPVTKRSGDENVLDPLDPRYIRRKKREKKRIFKEVYLPAIIAGVALFLILSFVVGFTANFVRDMKSNRENQKLEQQTQAEAANRTEAEFQALLEETDRMVLGYDYDGAIERLNAFAAGTDAHSQEITAKRAEYVNAQAAMQEWKDISTIANLSFHVLIADPTRAFADSQLGGQYNKNFVTTDEFSRILNQLYTGNYVLVDFNSFVASSTGVDGNDSFFPKPLFLPQGKKPIMLTETMVNYFEYMVDANKDGTPDAGGHGFANKLVVDDNGDIKAAYVDAAGNNLVGDYDFVPILEAFIKEHPDFSYKGARATLAVTGTEGIFGYRTNTSYVATRGQSYYDEEVVGARKVVEALREKGYNLASYTYSNQAYKSMTTLQIQAEIQNWNNQIADILGPVNTIVFARASDIEAYSGTTFNVLYNDGLRFFLNNGTSPRTDVNTTFTKQTRLMVTGEAMAWYTSQFSNYFDCNVVMDMTARGGSVPKG